MRRKFSVLALAALLAFSVQLTTPVTAQAGAIPSASCNAGVHSVLRLYRAFFDRNPDAGGAKYWSEAYLRGASIHDIRWAFGQSPEFARRYAGMNNTQFVTAVYLTCLDRLPDAGGLAYWVWMLDTRQLDRTGVVTYFSLSAEFIRKNPVVGPAYCSTVARLSREGHAMHETRYGMLHLKRGHVNIIFADPRVQTVRVSHGWDAVGGARVGAEVNGNWFGSRCTVFDGYSRSHGATTGCGIRDERSAYLASNGPGGLVQVADYFTSGTTTLPRWATDAVGGKILVVHGRRAAWLATTTDPTFTRRNPRTAAGVTAHGHVVLLTLDGRSMGPGATGNETADILAGLGVVHGVMLDGGGSTGMAVDGSVVNRPSDGRPRSVYNRLTVGQ